MSVAMFNDCVVIPHAPNWARGIRWNRQWETEIAGGVTGAEDRATGRPVDPMRRVEFETVTGSLQEQARLEARVLEAAKTGRAVVPLWARPSELMQAASGKNDVRLQFGRWPWQPGDFAFFSSKPLKNDNDLLQINVGGSASGNWLADTLGTGGSAQTPTTHAINTSIFSVIDEYGATITGDDPAPQAVYQSWREIDSATATTPITYTFDGLSGEEVYLVRIHFSDNRPFGYKYIWQTLRVTGATVAERINIRPGADFGEYTAIIHEIRMRPTNAGRIKVEVEAAQSPQDGRYYAILNGVELHRCRWEIRRLLSGTNPIRLKFTDRLRGYYPAGAVVCPLIFGMPGITDMPAETNWRSSTPIRIAEPLPESGSLGGSACPVETCGPDFPIWNGGSAPQDDVYDGCTGTRGYIQSAYVWGIAAGIDPNGYLTTAQIACHQALFAIEMTNYQTANPGTYTFGNKFWLRYPESGSPKSMLHKHAAGVCTPNNPTGDTTFGAGTYTAIAVPYCKT